jgi:hypothetical protein
VYLPRHMSQDESSPDGDELPPSEDMGIVSDAEQKDQCAVPHDEATPSDAVALEEEVPSEGEPVPSEAVVLIGDNLVQVQYEPNVPDNAEMEGEMPRQGASGARQFFARLFKKSQSPPDAYVRINS